MSPTEFQILANNYLSTDVRAFYHVPYTGFKKLGNPDYLNDLKNTYNNFPIYKLDSAVQKLENALRNDLPEIHQLLGFNSITVCVVPRAKAETVYHRNQMLFRKTVQTVVQQINGFIDGTRYIIRHTNTRTTHLPANTPNYTNDGEMPYPGITRDTCTISPNVRGSDILLIDDIYTPGVNIDEDAINALLNLGANTVTFYAVGRVIKD